MTYAEAIQFLQGLQMFGARPGLERILALSELAGNQHRALRFIHVAGTNGKGSTCAMLESIYRASGLRVGLFTSPHLVSFAERIQVNRQPIPEDEVARLAGELKELLKDFSSDEHPTFFEVVAVMALRHFAEQRCDLVAWETGLGGRLDATNIVTPLASVITNIGLDHQQWLGDTLDRIAAEKAGIIKPGVPVITAAEPGRGLEVILDAARSLRAPATVVGQASSLSRTLSDPPTFISAEEAWPTVAGSKADRMPVLPLPGAHQRLNAALALATVHVLSATLPVGASALRAGLSQVHWSGRMQLARTPAGQTLLLDGAHNADSAHALAAAFRQQFSTVRPTLPPRHRHAHAVGPRRSPRDGRPE